MGHGDVWRAQTRRAASAANQGHRPGSRDHPRPSRLGSRRGRDHDQERHAYLSWLSDVKGAKPSTMADYRYLLAEPGVPAKRGNRESAGYIMNLLGNITATKITVRDVEALLAKVSKAGGSARNANKHRAVVSAIFNYGIKESAFSLPGNPAALTDKRKEAQPGALVFYSPAEVEKL